MKTYCSVLFSLCAFLEIWIYIGIFIHLNANDVMFCVRDPKFGT